MLKSKDVFAAFSGLASAVGLVTGCTTSFVAPDAPLSTALIVYGISGIIACIFVQCHYHKIHWEEKWKMK